MIVFDAHHDASRLEAMEEKRDVTCICVAYLRRHRADPETRSNTRMGNVPLEHFIIITIIIFQLSMYYYIKDP